MSVETIPDGRLIVGCSNQSPWQEKKMLWQEATLDFQDQGFIKGREQLRGEIRSLGGIKLVHDAVGLGRDLAKAGCEMLALRRDPVFDGIGVPHGDGSPVYVLGGFLSSQANYFDFTHALNRANYKTGTLPWGHSNVLAPFAMADYMMPEIEYLRKYEGKRLKLVVHSLGGYGATAMLIKYPEQFVNSVEHIVYIGSPIPKRLNTALALGYLVLHMFEGDEEFRMSEKLAELKPLLASGVIKLTSIDSSYDPLVGGLHMAAGDNHYVIDEASHSALGMSKHAVRTVTHAFAGEEVDSVKYPNIHHSTPSLLAA